MNNLEDNIGLERLTKKIVRSAAIPDMPHDFTDTVMKKIAPSPKQSRFETRLTRLILTLTIIAVAISVISSIGLIARVLEPLAGAPWLLILTAGSVLLIIKLFETLTDNSDEHLRSNP